MEDILTDLIIAGDNPEFVAAYPRLTDTLYEIMPKRTVRTLIEHDDVERLSQLERKYEIRYTVEDIAHALRSGALKFVLTHQELVLYPEQALIDAAHSTNLELISHYLKMVNLHYALSDAINSAIASGNLDVVKYLVEHGATVHHSAEQYIGGSGGNLELFKYVIGMLDYAQRVVPLNVIEDLVIHGHYEAIKWLSDEGYLGIQNLRLPGRYTMMDVAIGAGRQQIVELLTNYNGCEPYSSERRFQAALKVGNLELIDRLCEQYSYHCVYAHLPHARHGRLDVLKMLHKHKIRPHLLTLLEAVIGGQEDVVIWLLEVEQFSPDAITDAIHEATMYERVSIFKLLLSKMNPSHIRRVMSTIVNHGSFYMMDYILPRLLSSE